MVGMALRRFVSLVTLLALASTPALACAPLCACDRAAATNPAQEPDAPETSHCHEAMAAQTPATPVEHAHAHHDTSEQSQIATPSGSPGVALTACHCNSSNEDASSLASSRTDTNSTLVNTGLTRMPYVPSQAHPGLLRPSVLPPVTSHAPLILRI